MNKESKWDEIEGDFLDFINEIISKNPDQERIEVLGKVLSYTSHFMISLEENDDPEFLYFFLLILTINDSILTQDEKQKIISKIMGILKDEYPLLYSGYSKFEL